MLFNFLASAYNLEAVTVFMQLVCLNSLIFKKSIVLIFMIMTLVRTTTDRKGDCGDFRDRPWAVVVF